MARSVMVTKWSSPLAVMIGAGAARCQAASGAHAVAPTSASALRRVMRESPGSGFPGEMLWGMRELYRSARDVSPAAISARA